MKIFGRLVILAVTAACCVFASTSQAATWSAAGDFDVVTPNGDWSYGYHKLMLPDGTPPATVDAFTPMTSPSAANAVLDGSGLVGWSPNAGATDPNIMYNNTGSIINSWGLEWTPGELTLGPHFSGAPSTKGTGVRWTAPTASDYAIDMTFTLNQGAIPQPVKVYHNGTLLLDSDTGTGLGSSVNYSNPTLSVAAGDTIDLIAAGTPFENTSLAGTISDGSTIWDVADDFSGDNNPNGDWAYGYHAGSLPGPAVYGFQPFNGLAADHPVIAPTGLIGLTVDSTTDPNILYNATDADIVSWGITWEPGDLTLGPHPGASASVGTGVRWTAPADGDYSIDASFILAQLDDSQPVHIYHNDVPLLTSETGGPNGSSADYSNPSLSVTAGDTIDFIVEAGLGRTVELEATISEVPEPSTIVLVVLGVLCLVGRMRRGKRS